MTCIICNEHYTEMSGPTNRIILVMNEYSDAIQIPGPSTPQKDTFGVCSDCKKVIKTLKALVV